MTAMPAIRRRIWVRAAALAAVLVLTTAPAASAASSGGASSGGAPSPRVIPLRARIVTLTPRIISVAPQQTRPDSFTVHTDVLFAFGSSQLSSAARAVLASVVQRLQKDNAGTVSITGYTDPIGKASYNIGLSRRRAASVAAYLKASVSNPGLTYETRGRGEADPVAPNTLPNGQDNPAGRQQNRRVVITYAPR
jgi:outer membrane protein OmpA-like peptidoglycan-associated protein